MADLKLSVIISAVDKMTAPIRGITNTTHRLTKAVAEASQRAGNISGFRKLESQTGQAAAELDKARRRLSELGKEIKATENPSKKLQQEFNQQLAKTKKLAASHKDLTGKLKTERQALKDTGVDTRNLAREQERAERKTRMLGKALEWKNRVQSRMTKFRSGLDNMAQRAANLALVGQASGQVSRGIFGAGRSLYDSVADLDKAKGSLATLGVENIELIAQKGRQLQGQLAGVTAAQFVAAAYDIKSGISTLTDEGVAQMTAAATLTAKATKALPEEMTSLFATGYGIFKRQFADMTDEGFGNLFSASIAKSVQQFKTTGAGMQQAIESAGAGATNLGMGLQDQLTTLGMLQTVMSGGEAGTALRAFAQNAAKAHETLSEVGVDVLDENGQLRALPDILADLKSAYGDTLDAFEADEIKNAFGTEEAMKLINVLYGQEDAFRANANAISEAGNAGLDFTNKMAKAADNSPTARWEILMQKFDLLKEKIANVLIPEIDRLTPKVGQMFEAFGRWVSEHKPLIVQIGKLALIVGIAAAAITPLILFASLLGGTLTMLKVGVSAVSIGITLFGKILGMVSMLATPLALKIAAIVAIVAAFAAAAYLVYKNWEPIWNWLTNMVNSFKATFAEFAVWILEKIQSIADSMPDWVKEKLDFSIDFSDTIASLKEMTEPKELPVDFRMPTLDEAMADMGIDKLKEKMAGMMPSLDIPSVPDIKWPEVSKAAAMTSALAIPTAGAADEMPDTLPAHEPAAIIQAASGTPQTITVHATFNITAAGDNVERISDEIEQRLHGIMRRASIEAAGGENDEVI